MSYEIFRHRKFDTEPVSFSNQNADGFIIWSNSFRPYSDKCKVEAFRFGTGIIRIGQETIQIAKLDGDYYTARIERCRDDLFNLHNKIRNLPLVDVLVESRNHSIMQNVAASVQSMADQMRGRLMQEGEQIDEFDHVRYMYAALIDFRLPDEQ